MTKFSIWVADSGTYLICEVIGESDEKDSMAILSAMAEQSRENQLYKMLVDVRKAKNVTSPFKSYDLAYNELKKLGFKLTLAGLISPSDTSHDFMHTVLQNAGYYVKLFHEEADALSWLEQTA